MIQKKGKEKPKSSHNGQKEKVATKELKQSANQRKLCHCVLISTDYLSKTSQWKYFVNVPIVFVSIWSRVS